MKEIVLGEVYMRITQTENTINSVNMVFTAKPLANKVIPTKPRINSTHKTPNRQKKHLTLSCIATSAHNFAQKIIQNFSPFNKITPDEITPKVNSIKEQNTNPWVVIDRIKSMNPKMDSKIASKVKAVDEYVMNPNFSEKKEAMHYSPSEYFVVDWYTTYDELISMCHDDLDLIYNDCGAFGLIAYTQGHISNDALAKLADNPDEIITRPWMLIPEALQNISANTLVNEYLSANTQYSCDEFVKKFGRHGTGILNEWLDLLGAEPCIDNTGKLIYKITDKLTQDAWHVSTYNACLTAYLFAHV